MQIQENVPISTLTTMRLGGAARYVITATRPSDIPEIYSFASEHSLPVWVMGGGANTIGHDDGYHGVILLNRIKGIDILSEEDGIMILRGMAGEVWDDFVDFACQHGYSGIEAMSMIPGTVGAAPVQNIGAYGQDISQVIESVEAYDTLKRKFVALDKSELGMEYRHTRFNHGSDAGRFVIISVTIKLHKANLAPPFYNSLQRYIDDHQETDFSPSSIRRMVSAIRTEKLPDPEHIASAGSFFKNILVGPQQADAAERQGIPLWRNPDGSGKINSGWLIEQCGFKGKIMRGIRVSDKAALILINESARHYTDLAAARDEIVGTIAEKYGLVLEQEPVEIN